MYFSVRAVEPTEYDTWVTEQSTGAAADDATAGDEIAADEEAADEAQVEIDEPDTDPGEPATEDGDPPSDPAAPDASAEPGTTSEPTPSEEAA
jgi:hypothetical protein